MKANVWIRKRKLKKGHSYAVQWQDPRTGQVKTESCGKDKSYANHLAAERRAEIKKGVYHGITTISYDGFMKEHLDRVSKSSYEEHDYALRKFKEVCNPKDLTVIDYQMLESFVCCRNKESVSPATVNKNLRTLQSVFSKAVKSKYITINPINKDNRQDLFQTESEPVPVVLSQKEFDKVLETCPDDKWKAMCTISYNAGLRRNEIVFLTWDDVDFADGTLTVRNSEDHRTKPRKVRTIPMNQDVIDVLKVRRAGIFKSPYIFRDGQTEWKFSKVFARIVVKAGYVVTVNKKIKNKFSFHDLRRTFGTNLANKGKSAKTVQKLMGHASLKTTMKY